MLASNKEGDIAPDRYPDAFGDPLIIDGEEANSTPSSDTCVPSGDAIIGNGELDTKSAGVSGISEGRIDSCGTTGFEDEGTVEGSVLPKVAGDCEAIPTRAADVDGCRDIRGAVDVKSDTEVSGLASINGRVGTNTNDMTINGVLDTRISTSTDVSGKTDESSVASKERDGVMSSTSFDESGYVVSVGVGVESDSVSFTNCIGSGRTKDEAITGGSTGSEKKTGEEMIGSVRFGGSVNFSNGEEDSCIASPGGMIEADGSNSMIWVVGIEETSMVINGSVE